MSDEALSSKQDLPRLLREAERRVNAHVFKTGGDDHLASIPADPNTDTDLLLMQAADEIERLQQRVAELEGARHKNDRWNVETTAEGFRICRGYHERAEGCQWEYFVPRVSEPPNVGELGGYIALVVNQAQLLGRDGEAHLPKLIEYIKGLEAACGLSQTKESSQVGCEGNDGLLRVHSEAETCDVCQTDYCDRCGASMQHKPDCPESEQAAQRAKSEREVFEIVHRGGLSHETSPARIERPDDCRCTSGALQPEDTCPHHGHL